MPGRFRADILSKRFSHEVEGIFTTPRVEGKLCPMQMPSLGTAST